MATTADNVDDDTANATKSANHASTTIATSFVVTGFGPFGGVKENPTTVIVRRIDSYLCSTKRTPSKDSDKCEPPTRYENDDNDNDIDNESDGHATNREFANGSIHAMADLVNECVILETSAQDVNKTMDRIRRDCCEEEAKANSNININNTSGCTRRKIVLLHLGVGRSKGFRLESCAYNEASFRIPDQRGYTPWKETIVSDPSHAVGQCYETTLDLEGLKKEMERDFPDVSTVVSTDPGLFVCNYVYCKSLEVSLPFSARNRKHPSGVNVDDSSQPITASATAAAENESGTNFLCESLFLHVPHFDIVPEEKQFAYVVGLIKNLAAQGT